jgi:hypothetical protein
MGHVALDFSYADFRMGILTCLRQEYGFSSVDDGSKAIHLNKDTATSVSVDVVPAFTYQIHGPRLSLIGGRRVEATGVVLWTKEGQQITNFPAMHQANGTEKNRQTGLRYKHVVRILKWMRNHMAENRSLIAPLREQIKAVPSFLIESLVYNCPNSRFGGAGIYDDVVSVLQFLNQSLSEVPRTLLGGTSINYWREVNEIKYLFSSGQQWSPAVAKTFVSSALGYMEV